MVTLLPILMFISTYVFVCGFICTSFKHVYVAPDVYVCPTHMTTSVPVCLSICLLSVSKHVYYLQIYVCLYSKHILSPFCVYVPTSVRLFRLFCQMEYLPRKISISPQRGNESFAQRGQISKLLWKRY